MWRRVTSDERANGRSDRSADKPPPALPLNRSFRQESGRTGACGRGRAGTDEHRRVRPALVSAGHNGRVAANLLADAGWHALVLEADDVPSGTGLRL
ncbi:hypothetical protein Nm8I071_35790 [Nonomuraea sp. TT08I-71]|nr:hypothetical protein Nm8I071_35790 [Nonomuraea sp. TT08I-71]